MKNVIICAGVVLALLLAGLISIRYVDSNSLSTVGATATPSDSDKVLNEEHDMSVDVANLPEIDYVPIYPRASFLRVVNESAALRLIDYEVDNSLEEVAKFYDEMLRKKGWVARGLRGYTFLLTWTNPTSETAWHLWLKLTLGATPAPGGATRTLVNINYGRFPDTDKGLPIYSDAHNVEVTHTIGQRQSTMQTLPAIITDVTYLTGATPEMIADFYNISMPEYSWYFYDPSNPGPQTSQSGSIGSDQGLTFSSSRDSWGMETVITTYLSITSAQQKDGQLLVRLHIEEIEAAKPDY